MSDRPSAINGKRSNGWGTLHACPACGQCLCFGCHPAGPCVDDVEHDDAVSGGPVPAGFTTANCATGFDGSWFAGGTSGTTGVAGLRMHGAAGSTEERFRRLFRGPRDLLPNSSAAGARQ
jgi:hypothetical protein